MTWKLEAANDNEPQDKTMNRVATSLSTKLFAMSTALSAVGAGGALTPQGQLIIANLMRGLFN